MTARGLQLVHSMSMSMMNVDGGQFSEENPTSSPTPLTGGTAGTTCSGDDDCDAGLNCSCRFNCLFCSDIPMLHVPWYCGTCV
jgi:hypothetical protein